jgi:hypothetical protein
MPRHRSRPRLNRDVVFLVVASVAYALTVLGLALTLDGARP